MFCITTVCLSGNSFVFYLNVLGSSIIPSPLLLFLLLEPVPFRPGMDTLRVVTSTTIADIRYHLCSLNVYMIHVYIIVLCGNRNVVTTRANKDSLTVRAWTWTQSELARKSFGTRVPLRVGWPWHCMHDSLTDLPTLIAVSSNTGICDGIAFITMHRVYSHQYKSTQWSSLAT